MKLKSFRYIFPLTLMMSLLLSYSAFADTTAPTADQSVCVGLQGPRSSAANGELINYTLTQNGVTTSHSATTDKDGCFQIAPVGVGLYSMVIDGPDTLKTEPQSIQLDGTDDDFRSGATIITLLEGDAEVTSTANSVVLADFSVLSSQWGTTGPDADFDENNTVNLSDFSILSSNFGTSGAAREAAGLRACGDDEVTFTISDAVVTPGESSSVQVVAAMSPEDSGVNALGFQLSYDKDMITIDSISHHASFLFNPVKETADGAIDYQIGAFAMTPIDGQTILTIEFTANSDVQAGSEMEFGWNTGSEAFCDSAIAVPQGTHVAGTVSINNPTAVSMTNASSGSATGSLTVLSLFAVTTLLTVASVTRQTIKLD